MLREASPRIGVLITSVERAGNDIFIKALDA